MGDANIAPKGTIWVCGACGRTAYDKYAGPGGWDQSCMLNAVLCHEVQEPRGEGDTPMWIAVGHGIPETA